MNDSDIPETLERKIRLISGVAFILGSLAAFVLAITIYARSPAVNITIGAVAFFFGYLLLRRPSAKASLARSDVELLAGETLGRPEIVTNYRALRELTGLPGFFRNLGITGLPLATITVTILFCVLAIASYGINAIGRAFPPEVTEKTPYKDIIPAEFPTAILELSKLLLGAFIGSFVGKGATVPISSGDARKASQPPAPPSRTQRIRATKADIGPIGT